MLFNQSIFSKSSQVLFLCLAFLLTNCKEKETPSILTPEPIAITHTLKQIGILPSEVNECSGFFYDQQHLFIINDSGGEAALYQTDLNDPSTTIIISLENAQNIDWEAITTTDTEIIIGDIGNNFGTRKDLNLLHFDKSNYSFQRKVAFSYPNQVSFNRTDTHNFDSEALVIKDNEYYLFTKNRGNNRVNLYTAPLYTGDFNLQDSIEVSALITDAYYLANKQVFLLLGNERVAGSFQSYLSIIQLNENGQLSLVKEIFLNLNEQLEAITLKKDNVFLLGSEREMEHGGHLFELTLDGLENL